MRALTAGELTVTKKDYVRIAAVLRAQRVDTRFDRARFLDACEVQP